VLPFNSILISVCMYRNWCEGISDATALSLAGKCTAVAEKRSIRSTLASGFLYGWTLCMTSQNIELSSWDTLYEMHTRQSVRQCDCVTLPSFVSVFVLAYSFCSEGISGKRIRIQMTNEAERMRLIVGVRIISFYIYPFICTIGPY
jgi:hypothetical protein